VNYHNFHMVYIRPWIVTSRDYLPPPSLTWKGRFRLRVYILWLYFIRL